MIAYLIAIVRWLFFDGDPPWLTGRPAWVEEMIR